MIRMEDLQPTLSEVVKAIPSLNPNNAPRPDLNAIVFVYDGFENTGIESALKNSGVCIEIGMPFGASTKDQSITTADASANSAIASIVCANVITIRMNPKANIVRGNLQPVKVFSLVSEIIKGVLSWRPDNRTEKGFSLSPERPFSLDNDDPGCVTYNINILKKVILS